MAARSAPEPPLGIHGLLAGTASRTPEAPAVVDGDLVLSYAELEERALALGHALRVRGVAPGDRVSILDYNSADYLVAYFGAAASGAVLNPLNHRLSAGEIATILEDAGSRVLLASPPFLGLAREAARRGPPGLSLLALAELPGRLPRGAGFEAAGVEADSLAHLYYTSGTTGRPKGVMLTHRNVCSHARAAIRELGLGAGDRWGHIAPLFHLADAWAAFAMTEVGGVHVMAPRFEAGEVLALLERQRITVTNLVPTMLTLLVRHPEAGRFDPSSLRLLLSGGAPIAPEVVRETMEVLRCEYAQTYGLTETSPYLTISLLSPRLRALTAQEQLRYRSRTGRPFAGVEVEVVDEGGDPVPRDDRTVGEVRARGETVSPGYWRNPEETARAFRGGWFYTGDLAVVDAEGYLRIVDRRKDMILSGGENVYSIEVENVLHAHPAVLECAVYGLPDPVWGEIVAAAVVARAGHVIDPEGLREFCRARIASFKVPRRIEALSELPRTGSGKIAKRALRERP